MGLLDEFLDRIGQKPSRPPIVVICGSMRFESAMKSVAIRETLDGRMVLIPHVNLANISPHDIPSHRTAHVVKDRLDRLHKHMIDLADEVIVVCPHVGGKPYIGISTASEISYAIKHRKPVRYVS